MHTDEWCSSVTSIGYAARGCNEKTLQEDCKSVHDNKQTSRDREGAENKQTSRDREGAEKMCLRKGNIRLLTCVARFLSRKCEQL